MQSLTLQIENLEDSQRLAVALAKVIKAPLEIGLVGGLGAGKTTLVGMILASLGAGNVVSSPTFVLSHEYYLPQFKIEHWDIYRLTSAPEELHDRIQSDVVRLIEWADKDAELLKRMNILVLIDINFSDSLIRKVTIKAEGAIIERLSKALH